MFGLEVIEVGIGLAFAFLAVSTICSGIVDVGVKLTGFRSKHLKKGLGRMLDDPNYNGFVKQLYDHHLISPSLKDKLGEPEYIRAKDFSAAVFDILASGTSEDGRFKAIESKITNTVKDEKLKKRLLAILHSSVDELESMRDKVENWFDESMEEVSEWYRIRMRHFVTLVSVVIVTFMNVDTIRLTKSLWTDNEVREATVAAAESYTKTIEARTATAVPVDSMGLDSMLLHIRDDINTVKALPVGWSSEALPGQPGFSGDPISFWLFKVLGLLLTIGAVSMGSTYWYMQLKSLLNLRFGDKGNDGGGKTPGTTVVVNPPPAGGEPTVVTTSPSSGDAGTSNP